MRAPAEKTDFPANDGVEWAICPVCRTDDARPWMQARDLEFGGSEQFSLVRCMTCGHIYQNPRPTPDRISDYYPLSYYTHVPPASSDLRRIYGDALRLVEEHGRDGKLLDIGTGDGSFLTALAMRGWNDADGIEPDPDAFRVAHARLGARIVNGSFPGTDPPRRGYNTVTMLETIEHLHLPGQAVAEVHRLLAPGGRLVITTPNIEGLEFRVLGANSVSLQLPRHLHFFSPRTLKCLLEATGLRVVYSATSAATDGLTRSLWLGLRRALEGESESPETRGQSRVPELAAGKPVPIFAVGDPPGPVSSAELPVRRASWRRQLHRGLDLALAPLGAVASTFDLGPTLLVVAERPQ